VQGALGVEINKLIYLASQTMPATHHKFRVGVYCEYVQSQGKDLRANILNHYYSSIYKRYLFESNAQSKGIKYFESLVEKTWRHKGKKVLPFSSILEIGAGQGEHWSFLKQFPTTEYVAFDLRELKDRSYLDKMPSQFIEKLKFIVGNAEKLPFPTEYFDRVFSTCLLHHVDEPLDVLLEARRVAKVGGELIFILPTDPGIANQMVKRFISFPAISRLTQYQPSLFYALEHKNHVKGLIDLIKFIFQDDDVVFYYKPFKIPSWNFNLGIGVSIIKSNRAPNYLKDEIIK
jgi:ubiquinone/menaquinone biosynthesis C-methylase UbiE